MTDPSTGSGHGRRFIEESFPVKDVSAISAKEKSIRHGHISTLHIWWARRRLAHAQHPVDDRGRVAAFWVLRVLGL